VSGGKIINIIHAAYENYELYFLKKLHYNKELKKSGLSLIYYWRLTCGTPCPGSLAR
jgi:hypothetical protein